MSLTLTQGGETVTKFTFKRKEAKTLTFTYNVDITSATFSLICRDSNNNIKFRKNDEDFDKSEIADKKVKINLTVNDLDLDAGTYKLELKTVWNETTAVDKTETFKMRIRESLFEN